MGAKRKISQTQLRSVSKAQTTCASHIKSELLQEESLIESSDEEMHIHDDHSLNASASPCRKYFRSADEVVLPGPSGENRSSPLRGSIANSIMDSPESSPEHLHSTFTGTSQSDCNSISQTCGHNFQQNRKSHGCESDLEIDFLYRIVDGEGSFRVLDTSSSDDSCSEESLPPDEDFAHELNMMAHKMREKRNHFSKSSTTSSDENSSDEPVSTDEYDIGIDPLTINTHYMKNHVAESLIKLFISRVKESEGYALNITVSFDVWLIKGNESLFGVGFIVEVETGLILDFEVQSKSCFGCWQFNKKKATKTEEEIEEWMAEHRSSCTANYDKEKSSYYMESQLVTTLFKRSRNRDFRYTTVISDDTSPIYRLLKLSNPYGDIYPITQEDGLNHIYKLSLVSSKIQNIIESIRSKLMNLIKDSSCISEYSIRQAMSTVVLEHNYGSEAYHILKDIDVPCGKSLRKHIIKMRVKNAGSSALGFRSSNVDSSSLK